MALKHAKTASTPQSPLLNASDWNAAHVIDANGITFNDATTQTTAYTGSFDAGSLTGTTLAGGVTSSSLTSVGTLTNLSIGQNLNLVASTSTTGQIKQAGNTVFHTLGTANTFLGNGAGNLALSTAPHNTAVGEQALTSITTGDSNVAIGHQSLYSLQDGGTNMGIGRQCMYLMVSGNNNVGVGHAALFLATGSNNTAIGLTALQNCSGDSNTGIGCVAGQSIVGGSNNTVIGAFSTTGITSGSNNTIIGAHVSGLSTTLASNVILATGDGTIRLQIDSSGITTLTNKIIYPATNTAAGTTGAQTINKPSGTVNFAAAATSLVVTNSLVTTSSIVMAVVRTNDTTATIKNVVPASGSFTITLSAAATAETSVGFLVIN